MKIKFSIIIPTLNSRKYLKKCLDSIFCQTFKNYEIIVVDGGSTDGTLHLLKQYKNKIKLFINRNDTQSRAINFGIKKSTGNWVTWQNSDDFYVNKNTFSSFAKCISTKPKKKLFIGNINLVNSSGKYLRDVKYVKPLFLSLLYEDMTMTNQACFWDKKRHKEIGYLKNMNINFDYEWFLRILNKYPDSGTHINKVLACFRLHKNQKTQNQKTKDIIKKKKIKYYYGFNKNLFLIYKLFLFFRRFLLYLFQGNFFYISRGFFKIFSVIKNKEYINN